jgi:hypothetical protein
MSLKITLVENSKIKKKTKYGAKYILEKSVWATLKRSGTTGF